LWKQAGNEIRRFLWPRGVFAMTLNRKTGRRDMVYAVTGFLCAYGLVLAITALVTSAAGYDILSSIGTSLAVTGNTGTGFGASGPARNYGGFPAWLKWFYSAVMIAGRLELWTVLVLLTPEFWKR
jgi:trk system potassium uptake protein TrkH